MMDDSLEYLSGSLMDDSLEYLSGSFPITNMMVNYWLERKMSAKLNRDQERDYPHLNMYYPQQYVQDDVMTPHGSVGLMTLYIAKYKNIFKRGCSITGTVYIGDKAACTFVEQKTGFIICDCYEGWHIVDEIEVNKDLGFLYVTFDKEVKDSKVVMGYEVDLECS